MTYAGVLVPVGVCLLCVCWCFSLGQSSSTCLQPQLDGSNDSHCISLDELATDSEKYLVSNSVLYFKDGSHFLSWSLEAESLFNVSWRGSRSSKIILLNGVNISWANSWDVRVQSLTIIYGGKLNNSCSLGSLVYFLNSSLVILKQVEFSGQRREHPCSRAIAVEASSILLIDCTFYGGLSEEGGALYLDGSNATFSGCTNFTDNRACTNGGAISSISSRLQFIGDIYFANNEAGEDGGAVWSLSSCLLFEGSVVFTGNAASVGNGGALYGSRFDAQTRTSLFKGDLFYSADRQFRDCQVIVVSGDIVFHNNTAQNGGGLYLLAPIQLGFQLPVNLTFSENAAEFGGAIRSEKICSCPNYCREEFAGCFFRVEDGQLSSGTHADQSLYLNFTKNLARSSGSDIFSDDLDYCMVQCGQDMSEMTGLSCLQNVSTFHHSQEENSSISSPPRKVCFCADDGLVNCSAPHAVKVPRGRHFNLTVVSVGVNDSPVPSQISTTFAKKPYFEVYAKYYYISSPKSCYNISFSIMSKNVRETFSIRPEGYGSSSTIEVEFRGCPSGFQMKNGACKCENALSKVLGGDEFCNPQTGLIQSPGGLWIQPVFENNLYVGFQWNKYCPFVFCNAEKLENYVWVNFSFPGSVNNQCRENRMGVLCGLCLQGHSLALDDFSCNICSNGYLSLVLVYLVAGILLVAFLILLHLTVAAGTINGVLLYANVLNISREIFFPVAARSGWGFKILGVFIAWLNLDAMLIRCFYDGLDFYSHVWLQFLFPFYLWVLMGVVIVVCKMSARVSRLLGNNPIAVLATILLMSYTKLLHTSQEALSHTYLEHSWESSREKVWYLDPSMPYFKGRHIPLVLFAWGLIFILIIPYILLLLFGYFLQGYSNRRWFRWFNNFTPLLDAYYAPFRKHTRCWPAVMLLVRGGLYITYSYTKKRQNDFVLFAELFVFVSIAILPWLGVHIYQKQLLEILEATFILNICFLSIATYSLKLLKTNQQTITSISVGVALVEFVGIVLFHAIIRLKGDDFFSKIKQKFDKRFQNIYSYFSSSELKTEQEETEDAEFIQVCTYVDIRESLLEDEVDSKL